MEATKVCTECKEERTLSFFHKKLMGKYGLRTKCKVCCRELGILWNKKNKDKLLQKNKEWYVKNRDKKMLASKTRADENREEVRKSSRNRYHNSKYGEYGQALFELNEAIKQMKGK